MFFESLSELRISEGEGMIDQKDISFGWYFSFGSHFKAVNILVIIDVEKISSIELLIVEFHVESLNEGAWEVGSYHLNSMKVVKPFGFG